MTRSRFFAAFYDSEMLRLEYVRKKKLRFDFGTAANDDMQWLGEWKGLLGLNNGNDEDFGSLVFRCKNCEARSLLP